MEHLNLIKNDLKELSNQTNGLEGIFLFGSYLNKPFDQINDIDVIFQFKENYPHKELKKFKTILEFKGVENVKINAYGPPPFRPKSPINSLSQSKYDIVLINSKERFDYFTRKNFGRIQRINLD
ncbi:hypothetical protein HYS72_01895 [Candidatus Pacearchaeota archaeon]|nr:hypothetical protein [Candidatus Pacearchaeota archaeon]MBI2057093.1 hypothetical protein [Candidatus Pacearchaeota archaeon]